MWLATASGTLRREVQPDAGEPDAFVVLVLPEELELADGGHRPARRRGRRYRRVEELSERETSTLSVRRRLESDGLVEGVWAMMTARTAGKLYSIILTFRIGLRRN